MKESPSSFPQSSKGIRQGDHLFPSHFCLTMEPLSLEIGDRKGDIKLFPAGNTPLSHLIFTDDVLMFCKADISSLKVIKDIFPRLALFVRSSSKQGENNILSKQFLSHGR